jgi:hypothetical protein
LSKGEAEGQVFNIVDSETKMTEGGLDDKHMSIIFVGRLVVPSVGYEKDLRED